MFDSLGDRLTGVFDRLTGRGVLSAADVDEALREVALDLAEGADSVMSRTLSPACAPRRRARR